MSTINYTFCPCSEISPSGVFKNAPPYIALYSLKSRLPGRLIFNVEFNLYANGETSTYTPRVFDHIAFDTGPYGIAQDEFRGMIRCLNEPTIPKMKRCMDMVRPHFTAFKRGFDL